MPSRATWTALVVGLVLGAAVGTGVAWVGWGRRSRALAGRLSELESAAAQVQGERERLRGELDDIVRERREMAATAERLRSQVDEQLRRLETLSQELAPPTEPPPGAPE